MAKPRYAIYGKVHGCRCVVGTNTSFRCGQKDHRLYTCPNAPKKGQGGRPQGKIGLGGQVQPRVPQGSALCNNRVYVLHARKEVEKAPDVVNGMLKSFDLICMLCLIHMQIKDTFTYFILLMPNVIGSHG